MTDSAWLFVPPRCRAGICKVIVLPGGCNAFLGLPPTGGSDDDFARYGFQNGIIVLKPCQTGTIDRSIYPVRFRFTVWLYLSLWILCNRFVAVVCHLINAFSLVLLTYSMWLAQDNHENFRGMVDVYGQLSPLYATQKGGQMEPTGKMLKRLIGIA